MRHLLVIIFIFTSAVCATAQSPGNDSLIIASFLGKPSPKFTVTTIDNTTYQIGGPGDNVYVINYWFIACGPCRLELPMLNELALSYKSDSTVRFIAISNIDKKSALEYIRRKTGMLYELVEQGQFAADSFKVSYYPVNIIVNKNGQVVFYEIGYHKDVTIRMKQILSSLRKNEN